MADKWPIEMLRDGAGRWLVGEPGEQRYDLIVRLMAGRERLAGAEVGVREGDTSAALLEALPGLCPLYAVDPWVRHREFRSPEYALCAMRLFCQRVLPWADRVVILRMTGEQGARHIPDGSLDFAFIDGDHRYDFVRTDLENYWPKVKPGGLLIGHDYVSRLRHWAVKRAVDERFGDRVELGGDRTWYVWKGEGE